MSRIADGNVFADLSGTSNSTTENPYDALLEACKQEPKQIQLRYQTHRETRNDQQKSKLTSPDFSGFIIDEVLHKLVNPEINPGYVDPRNCLVFWARPPKRIRQLVETLQKRLLGYAPSLWFMPVGCLHMTVLEITHSKTEAEIEHLVNTMESKVPELTDFTYDHRARLVKPMLSYDAAAIALSFLPAAGEGLPEEKAANADAYTYHHLRRDMYGLCRSAGVEVASRYVVPSSHLTIARFVTQKDISSKDGNAVDRGKIEGLVKTLEEINGELRAEYWSEDSLTSEGSWTVGEEKGLDYRKGTLWYGGGHSHHEGKGFNYDQD